VFSSWLLVFATGTFLLFIYQIPVREWKSLLSSKLGGDSESDTETRTRTGDTEKSTAKSTSGGTTDEEGREPKVMSVKAPSKHKSQKSHKSLTNGGGSLSGEAVNDGVVSIKVHPMPSQGSKDSNPRESNVLLPLDAASDPHQSTPSSPTGATGSFMTDGSANGNIEMIAPSGNGHSAPSAPSEDDVTEL